MKRKRVALTIAALAAAITATVINPLSQAEATHRVLDHPCKKHTAPFVKVYGHHINGDNHYRCYADKGTEYLPIAYYTETIWSGNNDIIVYAGDNDYFVPRKTELGFPHHPHGVVVEKFEVLGCKHPKATC